jgi:hypothetical protein
MTQALEYFDKHQPACMFSLLPRSAPFRTDARGPKQGKSEASGGVPPGLGTSGTFWRLAAYADLDAQYRVNNSFSSQTKESVKI